MLFHLICRTDILNYGFNVSQVSSGYTPNFVLEVENDVMLVQVFPHIALWLFLCIRVTNACSQSLGSLPV